MKIIGKNTLLIVFGMIIAFTIDVAAEAVISSGAVSYSNAATNQTTVSGALDELFSAVDINQRLGSANILNIGDGTITGAISTLNTNVSSINGSVSDLNSYLHQTISQDRVSNIPYTALRYIIDSNNEQTLRINSNGEVVIVSRKDGIWKDSESKYLVTRPELAMTDKNVSNNTIDINQIKSDLRNLLKIDVVAVRNSGTMQTPITAKQIEGYSFLSWLDVAPSGGITTPYIEHCMFSTTNIWDLNFDPAIGYLAFALYVKNI